MGKKYIVVSGNGYLLTTNRIKTLPHMTSDYSEAFRFNRLSHAGYIIRLLQKLGIDAEICLG
jgi:hypothetical protein